MAFADAYDFYSAAATKRAVQHTGHSGSVFVYLTRYLLANKSYLINTVGLCAIACFLPLLFGEIQGLNLFPVGLAILCLNTPICTLLSCDPDLEQAIRVLPGQAGRFCRRYCLFIFIVNGMVAGSLDWFICLFGRRGMVWGHQAKNFPHHRGATGRTDERTNLLTPRAPSSIVPAIHRTSGTCWTISGSGAQGADSFRGSVICP